MIEEFSFGTEEWVETQYETLKEFVKAHSRPESLCKVRPTNQTSFDKAYFYVWDNMGHMFWYRMDEDEFNNQWYNKDF